MNEEVWEALKYVFKEYIMKYVPTIILIVLLIIMALQISEKTIASKNEVSIESEIMTVENKKHSCKIN